MATTAVEKRNQELSKTAWDLLSKMKGSIQAVLPEHLTPERMAMIAFTAMRQNPKLLECSKSSIIASIMTASILGLEPSGPLQHGALVPYKGECQFQPMYKGLLELAYRTGIVKDVQVAAVYLGDHYVVERGLEPKLEHRPKPGGVQGRPCIAVYCVIRFITGGVRWDEMSYDEAIEHGQRYSKTFDAKSKRFMKDTPWDTNPIQMAQKTILIRTLKLCPKSPDEKGRRLAAALEHEGDTSKGAAGVAQLASDVFDIDVVGEEPNATASTPGDTDGNGNRGMVNLDDLKKGESENRGHEDTRISDTVGPKTEAQQQQPTLTEQLEGSLAMECEILDFKEIEKVADECGVSIKEVKEHVVGTMGFASFGALTKGRKQEAIKWIRSQRRSR